ncbi:DUF6122 family protein [Maribacter sp. PR1]|uniref:DUF6122 family protein n=1 Tax=Maribacter cobaltidurans TaxID=1178778 RepID=A0ABU7IW68_9FLAO|nr:MULTISPECIES: DUF6122 family protein [Maribacter]MDC6389834.1 DUF6122 family protein [Maribacter sp. PR1]MEE1977224.1 DUF6122 family protein [Maribacter cobaltidurans]
MLRFFIHYGIHFIVPFIVAFLFYKAHFWKISLILISAILIDIDHLLATPLFDANRCSIGFHPLHSYGAIFVYILMLFWQRTRIWGIAFLLHMIADLADCFFIRSYS